MRTIDSLLLTLVLALAPAAVSRGSASLTVSCSEDAPVRSVLGNPLEDGCVIRVGLVNLADPAAVSALRSGNTAAEVEAVFQSVGETGNGVVQPGGFQDRLRVNSFAGKGCFFGNIPEVPVTAASAGKSLCMWIYNAAHPGDATQWGIFGAKSGWELPPNEGTEALSTAEITDVYRGSVAGTGFRLATVKDGGYTSWALAQGGDTARTDSDGDGDTLVNLLEYALGTGPADAASPRPAMAEDGVFHFTADTTREDVEWSIECSQDMQSWQPATVETLETRDGIASCAATGPAEWRQCFFRVRTGLKATP